VKVDNFSKEKKDFENKKKSINIKSIKENDYVEFNYNYALELNKNFDINENNFRIKNKILKEEIELDIDIADDYIKNIDIDKNNEISLPNNHTKFNNINTMNTIKKQKSLNLNKNQNDINIINFNKKNINNINNIYQKKDSELIYEKDQFYNEKNININSEEDENEEDFLNNFFRNKINNDDYNSDKENNNNNIEKNSFKKKQSREIEINVIKNNTNMQIEGKGELLDLKFGDFIYDDNIKIIKYLSKGAQATVYLGHIVEIDKFVAIKRFLIIEEDNENDLLEKIYSECEFIKSLDNENIIKYYDIEVINKDNYTKIDLIMEYLEGYNLKDFLKSEDFIYLDKEEREKLIRIIIKKVLNGLAYLHENKIIHRDLKVN
jgi:hypothetical protein